MPLLSWVLSLAGRVGMSAATRYATRQLDAHLLNKPKSALQRAVEAGIQQSPEERRPIVRTALRNWVESPGWHDVTKALETHLAVTEDMVNAFAARDVANPLEERDRPRKVARTFLEHLLTALRADYGVGHLIGQFNSLQDTVEQGQREQPNAIAEALVRRLQSEAFIPTQEQALPPSDPYATELAAIERSLKDGGLSGARSHLAALEADVAGGKLGGKTRAKYLRLWGTLHMRSGDAEAAAGKYEEAFGYDHASASALTYRGYAALVRGHPQEALPYFDLALREDAGRDDTLALRAYAWQDAGNDAGVDAAWADLRPDRVELGLALARGATAKQAFDRADGALALLASGPHARDARIPLLRAKNMLARLQNVLQGLPLPYARLKLRAMPEGGDALALATQAIDALSDDPAGRVSLLEALNVRQVLHSLLGEDAASVRDGAQALALRPDEHVMRRNQVLAYLRLGQPAEAVDAFGRIPTGSRGPDVQMLAAVAYRDLGKTDEALSLFDAVLERSADLDVEDVMEVQLERTRTLLRATPTRIEEAERLLAVETRAHHILEIARAEVDVVKCDEPRARATFERAIGLARGTARTQVVVQYAGYLHDLGDFEGAADQLSGVLHEELPVELLEFGVTVLFQAGNAPDAAALIERVRALGGPHRLSTRHIEAWLTGATGDTGAALALYEALVCDAPRVAAFAHEKARIHAQRDEPREARQELGRLALLEDAPAGVLIGAAQLALYLDLGALALELAYRALRLAYADEETHQAYFWIALRVDHEHNLTAVQPECAVLLRDAEGGEQWVVLTADPEPVRERGEHPIDGPLAHALLGKTSGAKVELRAGVAGEVEIAAIITKYANAERRFLQEYERLFPTTRRMARFKVPEEQPLPAQLLDALSERGRNAQALWAKIKDNQWPLIAAAKALSIPEAPFWDVLFEQDVEIDVYTAHPIEIAQAEDGAAAGRAVLDVSVLLSLAHADLLEHLPGWLAERLVTQHVVDELHEALHDARHGAAGWRNASAAGGDTRGDSREREKERVARLERVLAFVRAHCTIVSVRAMARPDANISAAQQVMPRGSLSALLAAHEMNTFLLAEDVYFRRLAHGGSLGVAVPGLSTVGLLWALRAAGRLTPEAYADAALRLARLNITLVPVSPLEVQRAVTVEGPAAGPLTAGVVRAFTRPGIDVQLVAGCAATLAREAWLLPGLDVSRVALLRRCLDAVRQHHDLPEIERHVRAALRSRFRYIPLHLADVEDVLDRWLQEEWRDRTRLP